jgi:hypothetical protein
MPKGNAGLSSPETGHVPLTGSQVPGILYLMPKKNFLENYYHLLERKIPVHTNLTIYSNKLIITITTTIIINTKTNINIEINIEINIVIVIK